MGAQADPDLDDVRLDGQPIAGAAAHQTIALNKPIGYVTTVSDPHAERTVMDLVKGAGGRIYPIGRLDADSAGLLLLTNDGDLAQLLTHPSHLVPKTYRVLVRGEMTEFAATDLRRGVQLEDGMTAPARVTWVDYDPEHNVTVFDITITEGRNRQVRRMLDAVGYPVLALTRMSIGNLSIVGLAPGTWRRLRPDEIAALRQIATVGAPSESAQEPSPLQPEEPQPPDTVVHSTDPPSAPATPPAHAPRKPKKSNGHDKPGGGQTKPRGGAPRPGFADNRPRDTFGARPAANGPSKPDAAKRPPRARDDRSGAAPSRPKPDWAATRPIEGHPGLGKGARPRPPRPWDSAGGGPRGQGRPAPWSDRADGGRRGNAPGARPPQGNRPDARPAHGSSGARPPQGNRPDPAPRPGGRPSPSRGGPNESRTQKPAPDAPPSARPDKTEELREQARRLAETLGRDGPEERAERKQTPARRAPRPKKGKPDAP